MGEPVPPAAWAAALLGALAAGCPVAQAGEAEGNRQGLEIPAQYQSLAPNIAQGAQVAQAEVSFCTSGEANADRVDPVEVAEREAIQVEPLLPPPGSVEAARMEAEQRRMVAGLLSASRRPSGWGPSGYS
ncbi:hypothetical protein ACFQY5_18775 [Paeniroseomonas aquatica]|uniref:Uncharacterized protein n=1 Tax=Paeniroseomonas aquatica TaxID=373043 RepID=A0ABT8AGS9_9PROT|nr:hypothetical protein [Paeniroseomonas aquatica]MDN3568954.1 hypothetical protein [Paeniroseomonas aquatica]